MKYNPTLDGLRAYAIIMVLIVHFFSVDEPGLHQSNLMLGSILLKLSLAGLRGVELFFLLSGYLISSILLDSRTSPRYFLVFYARRVLRIFPLYYFVLLVTLVILPEFIQKDENVQLVLEHQAWLWLYGINLSSFFFTPDIPWAPSQSFPWFVHFWSLAVEEHFYLFWPMVIYFISDRWLPKVMMFFVVVSLIANFHSVVFDGEKTILSWSTIRSSGVLATGSLIAFYHRDSIKWQQLSRAARILIKPFLIAFIIAIFTPRSNPYQEVASIVTSVLFLSTVLIYAINKASSVMFFCDHHLLYFIGKISYGIYVYHRLIEPYLRFQLYPLLKSFLGDAIVATIIYALICSAMSTIIAYISFIMLENPALRLKRFFNY